MNDINKNEYDEIKSELKEIKSMMNVSASEFRLIYAADNFRRFFVLSGIFSLVLPLIYQVLLWGYKSAGAVPESMLWGFYALIALCWCVLVFVKTKTNISEAKRLGLKSDIFTVTKSILATKLMAALIPLGILAILFPIKFSAAFAPYDYIPYIGMAVGLLLNTIGVMIHEREYSFCGIWMLVSAAILFFLCALPGHISFAIIFAPGCFLFAAVNKYKAEQNEAG